MKYFVKYFPIKLPSGWLTYHWNINKFLDKIIGLPSDWFCISYPDVKAHPLYLPVELNSSFLLDRAVCYKRTVLFGQKEILCFFLFRLGSKDVSSYKNEVLCIAQNRDLHFRGELQHCK